MLTVKTYIDKSPIHGIGLFAGEFIPKDTLIWKLDRKLDLIVSQEEYEKLPPLAKEHFNWFAYYSESRGGWILCFDNGKFVNHSKTPNTYGVGDTIALRDIEIGEEITEDYYVFNEKEPSSLYK